MLALLIIPILVSGYIMMTANPYHFFRLHRHDGQLLYLKAAYYGTLCLIASVASAVIIKLYFPDFHPINEILTKFSISTATPSKDSWSQDRIYAWLILLSVCSIAFAGIWVILVWAKNSIKGKKHKDKHKLYKKMRQARHAKVLRKTLPTGSFHMMLLDALESSPKKAVLINMSSINKVYVGVINGLSEPNEKEGPSKYISIYPVMSGYRHKDTQLIYFTNNYPERKRDDNDDLRILISSEDISHISWFNFAIYKCTNNSVAKNAVQKQVNSSPSPTTPAPENKPTGLFSRLFRH